MEFVDLFKQIDAQKQINKLAKKYRNKKIVFYGAGMYSRILIKNYDLSDLHAIGVADRKFSYENVAEYAGFKTIKLYELKDLDIDVIVMLVLEAKSIGDYVKKEILSGSKNANVKIIPIVKKPFLLKLKEFFED